MKIIVGLGNPDGIYAKTYHNIGFMVLDEVAKANNLEFKIEKKHQAMIAEYIYKGERKW